MAKMPRARRHEIAQEVRVELVKRFPQAFMPKGNDKLPLAIGIHRAVRQRWPEVSGRYLSVAMHDYTSGSKYLRMLVKGASRIDLDGEAVDAVSAEAAMVALKRVVKMEKRWARIEAEKQAETRDDGDAAIPEPTPRRKPRILLATS